MARTGAEKASEGNVVLPGEEEVESGVLGPEPSRAGEGGATDVRNGHTLDFWDPLAQDVVMATNLGAFKRERDQGQTALHQSVIDGNLELVKLLVKFGADIRLANRDGWSALHIAAFGGHQDIVLYLIAKAKYSSGSRG
ncbi:Notch-regulated ankyrin repeat-containing protein [Varanus komodoensis]|nr:Notch-regulated ankyrin repeat-containing protein [Varanus komodoensis]